jgi:hypothetical protein
MKSIPSGTPVSWTELARKYQVRNAQGNAPGNAEQVLFQFARQNGIDVFQEVALTGSRFCACPVFSRVFFLVVVTWLLDVTKFDPFRVPLGVRMRNWKLCNTSSDFWSRDHFGSVLGVFSMTSASYNHRKPCVLYLA